MTREAIPAPPLLGGVSQQGAIRRLPSQVERQVNAWASPIDGLRKRHPIDHIAEVETVPSDSDLLVHTIERGDESYIIIFGQGWIRAFTTEGTLVPVRGQEPTWVPSFVYLDQRHSNLLGNPETFEAKVWQRLEDALVPEPLDGTGPLGFGVPVALVHDFENIGNDGVYQQTVTTTSTSARKHLSVFVKGMEADTGIRLVLREAAPASQTFEAAWAFVDGVPELSGSPSTGLEVSVEDVGGGWYRLKTTLQPDGVDPSLVDAVRVEVLAQGTLGPDKRVAAWGAQLVESDLYTIDNYPPYILGDVESNVRATTVQDFTFVANAVRPVRVGENTAPPQPSQPTGFVFVRQGAYSQQYTLRFQITGNALRTITLDTWNGTSALLGEIETIETQQIATFFALAVTTNGYSEVTASHLGSVLRLTSASTAGFDVFEVDDSFGDTAMVAILDSVERFSDLPAYFVDGRRIKVEGDETANEDDYWVRFERTVGTATDFAEGRWYETNAPSSTLGFDAETMPHQLVRMFDDETGSATGTPRAVFFSWGPATWNERLVGDDETNPFPSFVSVPGEDRYIRDVFLFRQRLGFISGINYVLSEAGRFFNLFRTTVRVVVDSDRIDGEAAHPTEKELHAAIPLDERCILFGTRTIFVLDGQPTLTPRTVESPAVVDLPSVTGPRPTAIARAVLFSTPEGTHSALRELFPLNERSTFQTVNLSEQAPRYLPRDIVEIRGRATEDEYLVAMRARSDPSALYIYKSYAGGGERIQSALWRYTTSGVILGMGWVDDRLFLVTNRSSTALEGLAEIAQIVFGDPVTKTWTLDADFDEGVLVNVNHDAPNNDQLQLDEDSLTVGFVVFGDAGGTGAVYRVNAVTGDLIGRYKASPTASPVGAHFWVNADGDIWLINRVANDPNRATKIGFLVGGTRVDATGEPDETGEYVAPPYGYSTALDRDSDGLIRTSRTTTQLAWTTTTDGGNGGPATVSAAEDECILLHQRVDTTTAYPLQHCCLDANGDVWTISTIADVGGIKLYKLDGDTGAVLETVNLFVLNGGVGIGGFTGIVDSTGVLWSSGRGGDDPTTMLRYTTSGGTLTSVVTGGNTGGIAEAPDGKIWVVRQTTIRVYNPNGTLFTTHTVAGSGNLLEILIDSNDTVWVSDTGSSVRALWKGNLAGTFEATAVSIGAATGEGPLGLDEDFTGKLWVGRTSATASAGVRIDPTNDTIDLEVVLPTTALSFGVGQSTSPGFASGSMSPTGTWTATHDGGSEGILWRTATWNSLEDSDSSLSVFVRAADDETLLAAEDWTPTTSDDDFTIYGQFIEVRVEFTRASEELISPILYDLTVNGIEVEEPIEPEIGAGLLNIEATRIGSGIADTDSTFQVCLDRRVTNETTGVLATYDSMANETTFTLPYVTALPDDLRVVTRSTPEGEGGLVLQVQTATPESVAVFGDHTETPVWIGEVYVMDVDLGRPTVTRRSGSGVRAPVLEGPESVLGMGLYLDGPVHLDVLIEARSGEAYRARAEPIDAGHLIDSIVGRGRFWEIPLFSTPDDLRVTLQDASHLATQVQALEWYVNKRQGSPRAT